MFKILLWAISIILLMVSQSYAQNVPNHDRIKTELEQIDKKVLEYKDSLKNEINYIWSLEDAKQITSEQAAFKKDSVANVYAEKIKNSVAISEHNISTEIRQRVDDIINNKKSNGALLIDHKGVRIETDNDSINRKKGIYTAFENGEYKKYRSEKRTTSQFVFAFGFNSLEIDGNIKTNEFTPFRSMFYELGATYNTRILKQSSLLHLKYGASFMINKLSATNDRVFSRDTNGQYALTNTGIDYDKNMFRNSYLVLPVHLEFDFSKKKYSESLNKTFFKSHQSARFGIGGFVGTHLQTLYKNKWEEAGKNHKEKYSSSYNVEKFIYGLSAYVGYKETSLYVKYNLNSMFKNQAIDANLISIGIRKDFN